MFQFHRIATGFVLSGLFLALAACGTEYALPVPGDAATRTANAAIVRERESPDRVPLDDFAATERFQKVAARIAPAARSICMQEMPAARAEDCAVGFGIDREMTEPNAYFTYDGRRPVIRASLPLLREAESDDEIAFILGHEYGHLIGRHVQKKQGQALAGAAIVGVLAAAATAADGREIDPGVLSQTMALGAAVGGHAWSQSYELESDVIGTHIARAAGYDPVKGARFFARNAARQGASGRLTIWGTHPADPKRMATVIETDAAISAGAGLGR